LAKFHGRLKSKFNVQALFESLVLANRLAPIAFGKMGFNQCAMGAFAQRFSLNGRETRLHSRPKVASCGQSPAEDFQGMQTKLPHALTLDQHPIVIPIREELTGADQLVNIAWLGGSPIADYAPGGLGRLAEVDGDSQGQL